MENRTGHDEVAGRRRPGAPLAQVVAGWIIVVFLVLGGCAEPWKAPVESRSEARYRGAGIDGPVYRVQSGDTLYGIAWRAGVDYRDLARWNAISAPYTIYVSQKLRVKPDSPGPANRTAAVMPPPAVSAKPPPQHKPSPPPSTAARQASAKPDTREPRPVPARRGALQWRWPTDGKLVETFSPSNPSQKGIKISGKRNQSVVAAESGEIVYSGSGLVGYGELIIIKHNNDYLSAYGYNNKRRVKEGQRVTRGDAIAEMGVAGGRPMLHFEIRRRGKPVDPVALLPRR